MKKFLLMFLTVAFSVSLYAQKTDTAKYADADKIFTDPVEVMPQFKRGYEQLLQPP